MLGVSSCCAPLLLIGFDLIELFSIARNLRSLQNVGWATRNMSCFVAGCRTSILIIFFSHKSCCLPWLNRNLFEKRFPLAWITKQTHVQTNISLGTRETVEFRVQINIYQPHSSHGLMQMYVWLGCAYATDRISNMHRMSRQTGTAQRSWTRKMRFRFRKTVSLDVMSAMTHDRCGMLGPIK